ncbi:MAG: hypothetical protein ACPGUV_00410 [Polyangiales bacterium]
MKRTHEGRNAPKQRRRWLWVCGVVGFAWGCSLQDESLENIQQNHEKTHGECGAVNPVDTNYTCFISFPWIARCDNEPAGIHYSRENTRLISSPVIEENSRNFIEIKKEKISRTSIYAIAFLGWGKATSAEEATDIAWNELAASHLLFTDTMRCNTHEDDKDWNNTNGREHLTRFHQATIDTNQRPKKENDYIGEIKEDDKTCYRNDELFIQKLVSELKGADKKINEILNMTNLQQ